MPRTNAHYGWNPSPPDVRDYSPYRLPRPLATGRLPSRVDLRDSGFLPAVKDQGRLGSCTANGICGQLEYEECMQADADAAPLSRLWLYWHERDLEGTVDSDAGAFPRDGFRVAAATGIPAETEWAYDIARFRDRPPDFADEAGHKALIYAAIPQRTTMVARALVARTPVGIGFTVYESFESDAVARTGMVPLPSAGEAVLGGHYVFVVGYLPIKRRRWFVCQNSWGSDWGDGGYFYLPSAYVASSALAGDLWAVQSAS